MFPKISSWIKVMLVIVFSLGMLFAGFPFLFIGSYYILFASSKGYIFWFIVLGLFLLWIGYLYPERKKYENTITCLSMISIVCFLILIISYLYSLQVANTSEMTLTQTEELSVGVVSIFLTGITFIGVSLCAVVAFLFWWRDRQRALNKGTFNNIKSTFEGILVGSEKLNKSSITTLPDQKSLLFNYVSASAAYMILTYMTGFIGTRILLSMFMIENLPFFIRLIGAVLIILLFCFISGYYSLYVYEKSHLPLTNKSHFIICSILYFVSFIAVLGIFQGNDIIHTISTILHIIMNYVALYYLQYKLTKEDKLQKNLS